MPGQLTPGEEALPTHETMLGDHFLRNDPALALLGIETVGRRLKQAGAKYGRNKALGSGSRLLIADHPMHELEKGS